MYKNSYILLRLIAASVAKYTRAYNTVRAEERNTFTIYLT